MGGFTFISDGYPAQSMTLKVKKELFNMFPVKDLNKE
jgi:hypothetical protein